jgi:hypothetical protein
MTEEISDTNYVPLKVSESLQGNRLAKRRFFQSKAGEK